MENSNKNPDPEEPIPELLPAPMAYMNPEFLNSPADGSCVSFRNIRSRCHGFGGKKFQDTVVSFWLRAICQPARRAACPDDPGKAGRRQLRPQKQPGAEDGAALQAALKAPTPEWRWRAITKKLVGWPQC